MKKLLIILCIMFMAPSIAKAEYFDIERYNVNVIINKDSSAYFEETILVEFFSPRHGIYRFIPYKYKSRTLRIKVLSVTSSFNGKFFNKEKYKKYFSKGNIVLRIGSKNRVYKGLKYYKIVYKVSNAIKNNEFYWNIIGTEWPVIIKNADFSISFPEVKDLNKMKSALFYGRFGNKKTLDYNIDSTVMENRFPVYLKPYNGITVDILFPKGIIAKPPLYKRIFWFVIDNIGYFIAAIILIFLIIFWNQYGKDEKKGVIVVRYEPPKNLTPAEVGTLIDDKVDLKDIVATILDLASKGYIKIIKEEEKKLFTKKDKIYFEKLKDIDNNLKKHEQIIYLGLFSTFKKKVSLDELKNRFYLDVKNFQDYMYKYLSDTTHLYTVNPETIRKGFRYAAYILLVFGIYWLFINNFNIMISIGIGSIISGIFFLLFSNIMPQKTHKGTKLFREILGFKEFIERVEKNRLERMSKDDPQIFGKILPYAVAMGIEEKWAEKFKGIDVEAPHWYYSPSGFRSFSTLYFVSSLNHDFKQMNTVFVSQPHTSSGGSGFSTGGGFSGGGFGGGGGGSW